MLDFDGNEILSMMVYQSEIILQLAIHSFKLLCGGIFIVDIMA